MIKVDEFDTDAEDVTEDELQRFLDHYSPGLGSEFVRMREENMLVLLPEFMKLLRSDYRRIMAGKPARYIPTIKNEDEFHAG